MNNNLSKSLAYKIANLLQEFNSLLKLIETDDKARKLFEAAVANTLALPMSLDDFISEWRQVHENSMNKETLFNSWKKSATLFKYIPVSRQAEFKHDNTDVETVNLLVFEDGAYINLVLIGNPWDLNVMYHVQVSNQEFTFQDYYNACDYLWENHSHAGYGE
jgi:hypothetical protein